MVQDRETHLLLAPRKKVKKFLYTIYRKAKVMVWGINHYDEEEEVKG